MSEDYGFRERAPHEAGYAAVFARIAAPELRRLQPTARRRRGAMIRRIVLGGLAGLAAAMAWIVYRFDGRFWQLMLAGDTGLAARIDLAWLGGGLIIIGLILGGLGAMDVARRQNLDIRALLFRTIAAFRPGWRYEIGSGKDFDATSFFRAGLVAEYAQPRCRALFRRGSNGSACEIADVELSMIWPDGDDETVFEGFLAALPSPMPLQGRLALLGAGVKSCWIAAANLPSEVGGGLTGNFQVRADNPEDAAQAADSGLVEALDELAWAMNCDSIRCHVDGDGILLAAPRPASFIHRPAAVEDEARALLGLCHFTERNAKTA